MFLDFLKDRRGNYMMMTAVAMLPIMGALALGIDYTEMNRQKQATLNALDAAGIAAARAYLQGLPNPSGKPLSDSQKDARVVQFAGDFFRANLNDVDQEDVTLTVMLPNTPEGDGFMRLRAELKYNAIFLPVFRALLTGSSDTAPITFRASTQVRLKNTSEIALVLDNSGSMSEKGSGSNKRRIDLLKNAAEYLVAELSQQAEQIRQVDKPVQFAVVPFSASVNVGAQYRSASWMDKEGLSPIHYENFDLPVTLAADKKIELSGGLYRKKGAGWGSEENNIVTRFTLFDELKYYTDAAETKTAAYTSWKGCVEARPAPYDTNDATPTTATPETLFVPMFAPDEWDPTRGSWWTYRAANSWWSDGASATTSNAASRQRNVAKYFKPAPRGTHKADYGEGPNFRCDTTPITPLTDVSKEEGVDTIIDAIKAMSPTSNTNVPEGIAWGWRALSHGTPFTEGRADDEKGNDKVMIVLTDGENTYGAAPFDLAGNKSLYEAYGYTGQDYANTGETRLYMGTKNPRNVTDALDQHMDAVCTNAKAANVMIFTVALDLEDDSTAIPALKKCASDSRLRKNADGTPAKLFWNSKGSDLMDVFKAIAEELSNLRIVS